MKHDKTAGPRREERLAFSDHKASFRPDLNGRQLCNEDDDDLRVCGWTLIDDEAAWEQIQREHDAERVGAPDEVRLAAGWRQQAVSRLPEDDSLPLLGKHPAPGPAGLWRLHASGVWVRWVVAS